MPRPRLFRQLGGDRLQRVTWVWGPPGAGKTTLVASYLAACRLRHIWYRVDQGDADLGSVFYYLAQAAPSHRTPLPVLTPEQAQGLLPFTQRFFRELFARLRRPFALVLDNYQEAPVESPFHAVVAEAMRQLPEGARILVTSRSRPPPAFARLRAERVLGVVEWGDLRFTAGEAGRLVRGLAPGRWSAATLRALHRRADGWAAGLVFLTERRTRAPDAGRDGVSGATSAIFDYFAGEVFDRADADEQAVLLATAVLPHVTAPLAEALTGLDGAGLVLDRLLHASYFTTRQDGPVARYQYHDLFREFLLRRAQATWSAARCQAIRRRAAALLAEAGESEAAAELAREGEDWPVLARLCEAEAPTLVRHGRSETLAGWLRRLPESVLDAGPALRYWQGVCRLPVSPPEAAAKFGQAYEGFRRRQDSTGMLLAAAGAADAIFHQMRLAQLDPWIEIMTELLRSAPNVPSPEAEAQVTVSLAQALVWRQPNHPELTACVERATRLVDTVADPSLRVLLSLVLLPHDIARAALADLEARLDSLREWTRARHVSPVARLYCLVAETWVSHLIGAFDRSRCCAAEGLALGEETGVHLGDPALLYHWAQAELAAGQPAAAAAVLARLASILGVNEISLNKMGHAVCAAWHGLLVGDLARARTLALRGVQLAEEIAGPFSMAHARGIAAQVCHALGEDAAAAAHLTHVRRLAPPERFPYFEYVARLLEAQMAFDRGDEAGGLAALRVAFAIGRRHGLRTCAGWCPVPMARLCVRALEAGIEVEHVRDLVRRVGLVPADPPVAVAAWPWPVRVYTLGRFEVWREGTPLRFTGKVQKRPLQLLKVMVALGGERVREGSLIDALWPESEGNAAALAFTTAIHRLRRLLQHDGAIRRQEGLVGLDPRVVWVDTWAVARLLDEADAEARRGAAGRVRALTERAAALWRGPFLEGDEAPWAARLGERLRRRLARRLALLADTLDGRDRRASVDLYERALEIDAGAEELYRGLMRAHERVAQRPEALAVYERCRETLRTERGMAPSPDTEALRQELIGQA